MKITVELSPAELDEIRAFTGENKKGPAVRKMVTDALMLKRREQLTRKFINGQVGVELAGYEAGRGADRRSAGRRSRKWKK